MSKPQHAANPSLKTVFIEAAYEEIFGTNTPDRNGTHRKDADA